MLLPDCKIFGKRDTDIRLVGYTWSVRYKRIAYQCTIYNIIIYNALALRALCCGVYIYKLINNHERRRFSGRVQSVFVPIGGRGG